MSLAKKTSDWVGILAEAAMLLFAVAMIGGLIWAVLSEWVF